METDYGYVNMVEKFDVYQNVISAVIPDIWELDPDINEIVILDVLLPNGFYMKLEVDREMTMAEVKEEVWECAKDYPLFDCLRDCDSYVFQCINLSTAQREELVEEDRRLSDVRPFQGILKLVEKKGDKEAKKEAARLKYTIGHSLQDFDEQSIAEVADFRKQMKYFCESITALLKQGSWEKRVQQLYPVSLESSAELPLYLQTRLHEGNLVLSISVDHRITEVQWGSR